MLEERGELPPERKETHIDIKVNAHIPESYISVSAQRMEMYKKISLIATAEDYRDIADEFIDRFGDMPKPVVRLLDVALMRALSEKCGIEKIEERGGSLTFVVGRPDLAIWSEVFSKYRGMRFAPSGDRVIYKCTGDDYTRVAASVVRDYYSAKNTQEA